MAFDTKYLLDDNKDFIFFTGKISKHIMSKKTQKYADISYFYDVIPPLKCAKVLKVSKYKSIATK